MACNHHNNNGHEAACCHEHQHGHEHEHEHEEHSLKRQLWLIALTALLLVGASIVEHNCSLTTWQLLLVYLIPYLLIGHETLHEAWEGLVHGDAMNEHLLMSVATIGALVIGFLPGAETQFAEAVFVMLFFQVGELFEGYAEGQSRRSIAHLMDLRPDVAHVEDSPTPAEEGETQARVKDVSPEQVAVGTIIVVRPGERIPIDGVVVSGSSALNTAALTGESVPRPVAAGDEAPSGCVNMQGVLRLRTTKSFGQSTVSRIIELVEEAGEHKSHSEAFITRFARIYTPVVVCAAVLIAVVPPLFLALTSHPSPLTSHLYTWLYRALMFLVVSCPCALVISIPLTFFGGIGGASRRGILIKGASYIDALANTDTVVFDKTGTLTRGQFVVEAVHPDQYDASHLLHLAAHVEHFSTHPIGAALRDAFPQEATDGCHVSDVEEVAGEGIRARVGDLMVCVGNTRMMELVGAQWHDCHHVGTIIHVAIGSYESYSGQTAALEDTSRPSSLASHPTPLTYAGHIVINDQVKADSAEAIASLKALGVRKTVMLTGDRNEVAAAVASQLGVDEYHAQLLPQDKVQLMQQELDSHLSSITPRPSKVAFVGDGINDAPVLASADVGIAMGGLGSDAAIEAADVVLMDDSPSKVATAIRLARRTIGIARQNVVFAIGVKVAVLILALLGLATMWMAVFADVGVTVLAVLNAMRALR